MPGEAGACPPPGRDALAASKGNVRRRAACGGCCGGGGGAPPGREGVDVNLFGVKGGRSSALLEWVRVRRPRYTTTKQRVALGNGTGGAGRGRGMSMAAISGGVREWPGGPETRGREHYARGRGRKRKCEHSRDKGRKEKRRGRPDIRHMQVALIEGKNIRKAGLWGREDRVCRKRRRPCVIGYRWPWLHEQELSKWWVKLENG